MLVAFSVENYRSFKDRVTLSLVAADLSSVPKELDTTNIFTARDTLNLLTSAAIYGANASGKSNLVAAMGFMRNMVLNSSRETRLREPVRVTPFRLNTVTEQAPSRFEVVFIQQEILYRYGFLVSQTQIEAEWLYATTNKKEAYLFERTFNEVKVNERTFKEGNGLQERTRPNALFLSVSVQWNGKRAANISEWFEQLTVDLGIDDPMRQRRLANRLESSAFSPEIVVFIRGLDLGIEDVVLEREPAREVTMRNSDRTTEQVMMAGSAQIRTAHAKYDDAGEVVGSELFDLLTHESQGTRRLFALAQPILNALRTGTVLVIDEIDARLHPMLTCEIIRLFNSPETNSHRAQLIFTTHDTNLLESELLRRDQIWFVEKSRRGESTLYSLVEYKVRNNAPYEKNYIAGRYGAIPYLGSLSAVIGAGHAEQTDIEAAVGEEAPIASNDSDVSATLEGDAG